MFEIKISRDFSMTPGARYREEGEYSGQEFRDEILIPQYKAAVESGQKLIIDLDGCYGYATSFLEEAFGGLVRMLKIKGTLHNIELRSREDETLVELIVQYVREEEERL